TNSLVLAVPADNPAQVTGLHDLGRPELQVVLCAPQVPCGALTVAATTAASVDVAPDSLEPNVRAVLQRLELGEADVGLVYRTDVAGHAVEVVDVEALDDLVAEYHFVDLTGRDSPTDSSRFVDLLLGPTGQRILTAHGFGVP
ncbi:MAG: substrate-binding domain-containing protein, partial [Acidimicrobiales bacterium]